MKRSATIRTHLLALVMAVIVPMLLLVAYNIADRTARDREQALQDTLAIARSMSLRVDDHLQNLDTLLLSVSAMVGADLGAVDANDARLRTLQASLPVHFNSISVLAPDGSPINSSTLARPDRAKLNFRDRDYFQQALARPGAMVIGEPVVSRGWGFWILVAARPLLAADGSVRAVVAVSTRLESIQNLLLPAELPEGSVMTILNAQGIVLARLIDPQQWIGKNLSASPNFQRALVEREFSDETVASDGVRRLAGYTTARQAPWVIYVGIPGMVALENVRKERMRLSALALLIAIIAVALAYLLARRISRPIETIARSAQEIASGQSDLRIAPEGPSEIVKVSDQFNHMLDEMAKAHERLLENEHKLRLFVEHAPAAIAMLDRDMRYIAYSRRWLSDYGLGNEDLLAGRSHYEVFPDLPERWKSIHQRCLAGAVESCEEEPFPRHDGSVDWVRWEIRPWHAADGKVAGIIIFSEIITARKQAEDKIAQQLRELQRWHEATLGREDRVRELKNEVNELLNQRGHPARYDSQSDS